MKFCKQFFFFLAIYHLSILGAGEILTISSSYSHVVENRKFGIELEKQRKEFGITKVDRNGGPGGGRGWGWAVVSIPMRRELRGK